MGRYKCGNVISKPTKLGIQKGAQAMIVLLKHPIAKSQTAQKKKKMARAEGAYGAR